jgi:hypothetical protein
MQEVNVSCERKVDVRKPEVHFGEWRRHEIRIALENVQRMGYGDVALRTRLLHGSH